MSFTGPYLRDRTNNPAGPVGGFDKLVTVDVFDRIIDVVGGFILFLFWRS